MEQANPKVEVQYTDSATVVKLTDERILEQGDIIAVESSIMPLIEQSKGINLIIDFSNVQFLSSSVLGLLVRISKKIYEGSGQLRLCGIGPKILEIFRITRLDRVFEIHENVEEAEKSLN